METIYKLFDEKKIGKKEVLHVNYGENYEFIKIGKNEYVIKHQFSFNNRIVELSTTTTTINAAQIYKRLHNY